MFKNRTFLVKMAKDREVDLGPSEPLIQINVDAKELGKVGHDLIITYMVADTIRKVLIHRLTK